MSLDIFFLNDVTARLTALDESNAMTTDLALTFGADRDQIQIARYAYQSALAHVGTAFGLGRAELAVILERPLEV